jgi:hypothetical protein
VGGHLLQAYGHTGADATVLLAPMTGFPLPRDIFERTVAAVERDLRWDDYVRRYRADDGLSGREGAFLICSFWLVDAYLALDRERAARGLFERLLTGANDVGLFAEEIDPGNHAFLGNFPQAFTHLALVGNAINFDLRTKHGRVALTGAYGGHARLEVGATFGWRAWWEACKTSGRVGRLWSSCRSIMPAFSDRLRERFNRGNTVPAPITKFMGTSPHELREQLQSDHSRNMRLRRAAALASLLGIGCMAATTLLQMGAVDRLPDLPIGKFNTKKVNLSDEAFSYGGPDSPINILGHAVDLVLTSTGSPARARKRPWLPLLAVALEAPQSAVAAKYLFYQMPRVDKAWYPYCIIDALTHFTTLALMLPEAIESVVNLFERRA